MSLNLMGKKEGMTQIFDDQGNLVVCTVISAEPNVVSQVKTVETDGYNAIQLASGVVKATKSKNLGKPVLGHFKKSGINPRKNICESRIEDLSPYTVGQEIGVEHFEGVLYVDATAISKGKGFQGVMKRYHFSGGRASHGSSFHRAAGSTGMRTTPGRVVPGKKMAGHMGCERVTTQNLKVVRVDKEKNVILVEGSVPGATGSLVYIRKARKK